MERLKRTEIVEIFKNPEKYIGQEVFVRGWARNNRFSSNIGFIELSDGTSFKNLQLVLEKELENFKEISKLTLYSSVKVLGEIVKAQNEKQIVELNVKKIEVEFLADDKYPLQNKRHTNEYLRTIAHLRPRTNIGRAVFKIRSVAAMAIHEYFQKNGFMYIHTPIITGSDSEGAGELFRVTTLSKEAKKDEKDFFGKDVYLTVSGQLNVEPFAEAYSKVYTFGPTFRAENSNTTRHAAEFWMIEPEMAFTDLDAMLETIEESIKYIISTVLDRCKEEMEFLNKYVSNGIIERLENLLKAEFGKITYTEAIEKLKNCGHKFETEVFWGIDLETEHERYLAEVIYQKPVFLTNYPKDIKAFYMKQDEGGKTVAAADLLVPGIGELVGGSQREDILEKLEARIDELGLDKESYEWYLDLRRFGSVEHSGFGLGFERLIMYLTGVQNIRDVLPYPRTPRNCEF